MSRTRWRIDEDAGSFEANRDGYGLSVWPQGDGWCWQVAGPATDVWDGERALSREAKLAATRCYQEMRFQEEGRETLRIAALAAPVLDGETHTATAWDLDGGR